MYDPQDDKGECPNCNLYYDSHTDEQHDECDLQSALDDMPKKGLKFLVYRNPKDMGQSNEYGAWKWIEQDDLGGHKFEFVRMTVNNGEILEDLG